MQLYTVYVKHREGRCVGWKRCTFYMRLSFKGFVQWLTLVAGKAGSTLLSASCPWLYPPRRERLCLQPRPQQSWRPCSQTVVHCSFPSGALWRQKHDAVALRCCFIQPPQDPQLSWKQKTSFLTVNVCSLVRIGETLPLDLYSSQDASIVGEFFCYKVEQLDLFCCKRGFRRCVI